MKRHFEGIQTARLYALYRPAYPDTVAEHIINYCKRSNSPTFELAVDIGCGTGQGTGLLTKYYKHVIGTDISEAQITEAAAKIPEVEYRVQPAEDLSFLADDCVDLITVAQALHWFDREKFYLEVARVLRPGGVLAAYGQAIPEMDNEEAGNLFCQYHDWIMKAYGDEALLLLRNNYGDISLPFREFERDDSLVMPFTGTMSFFKGYLDSWSCYRNYLKEHPSSDVLGELLNRMVQAYGATSLETCQINATAKIFLLLARK